MIKTKKGEYLAPEIEVVQIETSSALLDGSIEISGDGSIEISGENPVVDW